MRLYFADAQPTAGKFLTVRNLPSITIYNRFGCKCFSQMRKIADIDQTWRLSSLCCGVGGGRRHSPPLDRRLTSRLESGDGLAVSMNQLVLARATGDAAAG